MARTAAVLATVLVAVVGLAACGRAPAASSAPPPIGPPNWTTAACPTPGFDEALVGEPPTRHAIPDDFRLAWVLRCSMTTRYVPGQWGSSVLVTERADPSAATATEMLKELRGPSDPPSSHCPGDSALRTIIVVYFALVDSQDRALVPGVPTDGCGKPRSIPAMNGLRFHPVSG